ncbi:LOW QUALITY PROTEIN: hypothetical protein V2J09_019875 [Rumex salicifolius]
MLRSSPDSVFIHLNGHAFSMSAEFKRAHSPAADSKIRSLGVEMPLNVVIFGRGHVGIMSAEPIGNYGARLVFDDLHKTGSYTLDCLYHLGSNKSTERLHQNSTETWIYPRSI